jgi:hypothetical protein
MTNLRPGELRVERMHDDEGILRIHLPRGIGFVEIRANSIHSQTGYPMIAVELVCDEERPAADGRVYEQRFKFDGSLLYAIGKPGPKLLEQERFMREMAEVITAHDSGDHTKCPPSCPTMATNQHAHDHCFGGDVGDDEMCIADPNCTLTFGQYRAGGR